MGRLCLCLVLLFARVAAGQGPVGPEFQVNTFTTGYQSYPSLAATDRGFVVVWDSPQDGHGRGVFARRYDFNGGPGPVFQVNQYTTSWQWRPRVAADANGGFVVAWQSHGQDGSDYGVFARRFDLFGPVGPEFAVNTYTTGRQRFPSAAMDPDGRFVVVWTGLVPGGTYRIFGRAFDTFGAPVGDEFRVSASTTGEQHTADVAMDGSAGFVVAWDGEDAHFDGVFARRFAPGAIALGGDLAVNTYTTGDQYAPSVSVDASGNFVVAFIGEDQDDRGIFARRYDAAGTPSGTEFQVNTYTTGGHDRPVDVAFDAGGRFVVAWTRQEGAGDYEVAARAFDASAIPRTDEFRLNSHAADDQAHVALAFDGPDEFLAAWMSRDQDGDGWGVFGRRFDPDRIFADGFESGGLSAWSSAALDGGDLAVSAAASLAGNYGLSGLVDDAAGLFVQDDSPNDENRYRARFYLDPNGFDPGEASGARRTRVFILFEEDPQRRVAAVVLRRVAGAYAIQVRARLDDNSQYDTGFFPIGDFQHFIELDWKRSSAADASDGSLELWIDGVSMFSASTLDTSRSAVDFVRLGALSVKPSASGTLHWDAFESRRTTYIGP